MPSLTVWRFPTPYGADQGELRLKVLREQGALVVHDAATVVWFADGQRPRVRQLKHMKGSGALGGAFWGTLLGSVFLMPFAGAAVGAATGALHRKLSDAGISDDFVKEMRERITPGTSAIIVLSSDADIAKVRERFLTGEAELIYADLDEAGTAKLRELEEQQDEG
jgi:uncharacterized membrane protein